VKLFSHYAYRTLANTYLIGPDEPGDAIIVDPSVFDVEMLELVESNGYYIRSVLLTHCDESHLHGLRTIRRVYDCEVYAARSSVLGESVHPVSNEDVLDICCAPIRVIGLPGHGRDSIAYLVADFLFTGSALSAAEPGEVGNSYARAALIENIKERVLTLPDHTVVLPFFGPPSTVSVEKQTLPTEPPDQQGQP
jgi:glyoxylase-like metal-dependent hydrolase (beta-lactamase superfamily II)